MLRQIGRKATRNMHFCNVELLRKRPVAIVRAKLRFKSTEMESSRKQFEVLSLGLEGQALGFGLEASSP